MSLIVYFWVHAIDRIVPIALSSKTHRTDQSCNDIPFNFILTPRFNKMINDLRLSSLNIRVCDNILIEAKDHYNFKDTNTYWVDLLNEFYPYYTDNEHKAH